PQRTGGAAGRFGPCLAGTDQQGARPGAGLESLPRRGRSALRAVGHALAVVAVAGDRIDPAELGLLPRAHALEEVQHAGDLRRRGTGLLARGGRLVGPRLPEGGAAGAVPRRPPAPG